MDWILKKFPDISLEKYLVIEIRRSLAKRWGSAYMQGCFGDPSDFDPDGLMAEDIGNAIQSHSMHRRLMARDRATIGPTAVRGDSTRE